ncbi:MAG: hypothetical protein MRZ79_12470 [Bacteroidia bacterium]|nr:hypothetical protein [Bacteroidia bacterium]
MKRMHELLAVSPKHLYNLPGREHYSIQWQRKLLRDIRDFVGKKERQVVTVKDVAEYFHSSPDSMLKTLFPQQSETKRNAPKANEIQPLKKAL